VHDERQVVERAKRGDGDAFEVLYRAYVDRVYAYIAFRVRQQQLAEDLTQEVFIQALRAIGGFDWRGSLAPWLLRIARNTIVDHWRRMGRRADRSLSTVEAGEDGDEESLIGRMPDAHGEEGVAWAEAALDREQFVRAAAGLTALQQQVLALRFAAELSIKETAEIMGRSEGAIKNLQHHALRALRRELGWDEETG